jgi:hypothetical protein
MGRKVKPCLSCEWPGRRSLGSVNLLMSGLQRPTSIVTQGRDTEFWSQGCISKDTCATGRCCPQLVLGWKRFQAMSRRNYIPDCGGFGPQLTLQQLTPPSPRRPLHITDLSSESALPCTVSRSIDCASKRTRNGYVAGSSNDKLLPSRRVLSLHHNMATTQP